MLTVDIWLHSSLAALRLTYKQRSPLHLVFMTVTWEANLTSRRIKHAPDNICYIKKRWLLHKRNLNSPVRGTQVVLQVSEQARCSSTLKMLQVTFQVVLRLGKVNR